MDNKRDFQRGGLSICKDSADKTSSPDGNFKEIILSENARLDISAHGQNIFVVGDESDYNALAVSNILQRSASYVASDPSGLLFDKTHASLKDGGYKIVKLGPGGSSYNIFRNMDGAGIENLCAALSPHNETCRKIMETMLLFCFCKLQSDERSAGSIKRVLLDYKGRCLDAVSELKDSFGDRDVFRFVLMLNENAIWSNLKPLFDIDPETESCFMEGPGFDIGELSTGKTAVYVSSSCSGIVFSTLVRDFAACCGGSENPTIFFPGYLPECRIRKACAVFATSGKLGISLVYYADGISDVDLAYGEDKEDVFRNTNALVYVKTRDPETAEHLADCVQSVLTKNEIMSRPEGSCIVFSRGNSPVFDDLPAAHYCASPSDRAS